MNPPCPPPLSILSPALFYTPLLLPFIDATHSPTNPSSTEHFEPTFFKRLDLGMKNLSSSSFPDFDDSPPHFSQFSIKFTSLLPHPPIHTSKYIFFPFDIIAPPTCIFHCVIEQSDVFSSRPLTLSRKDDFIPPSKGPIQTQFRLSQRTGVGGGPPLQPPPHPSCSRFFFSPLLPPRRCSPPTPVSPQ